MFDSRGYRSYRGRTPRWKILAAVALVMALGVTGALAAGRHDRGLRYTGDGVCDYYGTNCANFSDADGDGVCDYHGTGCANFCDDDGDGVCDYHGTNCANFCDDDGDGACDNYGAGLSGGHHAGGHHGSGRNH